MIEIPILFGRDVLVDGDPIPVLDTLLRTRMMIKRMRKRKLCPTTQRALSAPYIPEEGDFDPDPGLNGEVLCVLLQSEQSFEQTRTFISLLDTGRGDRSVRALYGADLQSFRRLFLFYPANEEHALLMRSLLF